MAATVTVACKVSAGLVLRVYEMTEGSEPVLGGGSRTVQVARMKGEPVTLRGPAMRFGQNKSLYGGYALTHGVDAEFWETWLKQNAESALVINRQVFAHEKQDAVEKRAVDNKDARTGLEPLDPKNLPSNLNKRGLKIETITADG